MTTAEFLLALGRANLAIAAAIVLVVVLRMPLRRWLGARAAYRLWLLPALAAAAVLLPARIVTVEAAPVRTPEPVAAAIGPRAAQEATAPAVTPAPSPVVQSPRDPWPLLLALWLAGTAVFGARLAVRQRRFLSLAAKGEAGPAAVGVIRPRIVLPADFATRFTAAEQQAVLAHEQAHLAAGHPRVNGLVAVAQGLCWFNPLVHLGAHLMRMDQELACDAAVVAHRPAERRLYAQTLLKTQLAATPLPLGCYWPAGADHPLTMRVEMLNRAAPSWSRRILGAAVIAALAAGFSLAAWAAQPAQVRMATAQLTDPADIDQAWLAMRSLEVDIANQERFLDRAPDPAAMRAFIADERTRVAQIRRQIAGKAVSETLRRSDSGALAAQRAEWAEVGRWDRAPAAGAVRATIYCSAGACAVRSLTPAAPSPYAQWAIQFGRLVMTTASEHLDRGRGMLIKVDLTAQTITLPVSEALLQSTPQKAAPVSYFLGLGPKGLPLSVVPPPSQPSRPAVGGPVRADPWKAVEQRAALTREAAPTRIVQMTGTFRYGTGETRPAGFVHVGSNGAWRTRIGERAVLVRFVDEGAQLKVFAIVGSADGQVRETAPVKVASGAAGTLALPEGASLSFTATARDPGPEDRTMMRAAAGARAGAEARGKALQPAAPPVSPPRTIAPDRDAPIHLSGPIVAIDWTQPRAVVHVADRLSGKTWMVETGSTNTLRRGGIAEGIVGVQVEFEAFRAMDKRCAPECKALMRSMTLPDGRKVFLGPAPSAADELASALAAGDWRRAAGLGASAPQVMRALQAKGLYRELDADEAVVVIGADNTVEVVAMKPLPPIRGAAADARTAPLAGTGFEFSRKPGSTILYPPGGSLSQSGR